MPARYLSELLTVQSLAHKIWFEHYPGIISHRQVSYMLEQGYSTNRLLQDVDENICYHLLYIAGEPAGFSAYSTAVATEGQPGAAHLHKLYLLTSFHGKGIGSTLLRQAENQCRMLHQSTLALNVNKHNTGAIKAYRRNGFIIRRSTYTDIGEGFYMDDFHMSKTLAG